MTSLQCPWEEAQAGTLSHPVKQRLFLTRHASSWHTPAKILAEKCALPSGQKCSFYGLPQVLPQASRFLEKAEQGSLNSNDFFMLEVTPDGGGVTLGSHTFLLFHLFFKEPSESLGRLCLP